MVKEFDDIYNCFGIILHGTELTDGGNGKTISRSHFLHADAR